jgi:hypothetical protein
MAYDGLDRLTAATAPGPAIYQDLERDTPTALASARPRLDIPVSCRATRAWVTQGVHPMVNIDQLRPDSLDHPTLPADLNRYRLRFLGQGDSWFSIGAFPPTRTANLFFKLMLPELCCVVNCAHPGAVLARMTDTTRNPTFLALLSGNARRGWEGLLLSGGGNDVIDAAQAAPDNPPAQRLLARTDEWGEGADESKYLSSAGWDTLRTHLHAVFDELIAERDSTDTNRGIPVVLHTYDFATPRPSGNGGQGWLRPALVDFGIPQDDWIKVSRALLTKLAALLREMASRHPNVHVVETLGTLDPASTHDSGRTRHWENEIHPSKAGYELLGTRWTPVLTQLYRDRWEMGTTPVAAPAQPPVV